MVSPDVVSAATGVADTLLGLINVPSYSIAAAVVNLTPIELPLIHGIHTHHGQYNTAPVKLFKVPESADEETNEHHDNISVVEIDSAGAAASEAVWGYEFEYNGRILRLCLYAKHGKQVEGGCALWEKGQKVGDEDYDSKIHKAAESLIHTMQKGRDQTAYSRNGEATTLDEAEKYGLKISFSSGKKFTFFIELA